MNITDLLQCLASVEHERYAVAVGADVNMTEAAIGRSLPPSFRVFVIQFSNGAYLYGTQEVSATGNGNRQIVAIQDIVLPGTFDPSERLPFRDGGDIMASNLVPFSLDHNGNAWCFLADSADVNGECPVAYLDTTGRKLYGRLNSLADWFGILVETESAVIRTLYDDEVQFGELGLG
jgi:hypothetical protein